VEADLSLRRCGMSATHVKSAIQSSWVGTSLDLLETETFGAHRRWFPAMLYCTDDSKDVLPSVLLTLLVGRQEEHPVCKN